MTLEAGLADAIIERAARGDETAFARLVDAYHADLVRVAYVTCGDPDLAQDAAQAAWTIAWRKLGSVREPDRVKSWLVAVAAAGPPPRTSAASAGHRAEADGPDHGADDPRPDRPGGRRTPSAT
jgi:hypothetical protein